VLVETTKAIQTSTTQVTSAIPTTTSKSVCSQGNYGDGIVCIPCKSCSRNAASSGSACPEGSTADGVICTCYAGYYGDGVTCSACKTCDKNATTSGSCLAGRDLDEITCTCNLGFVGSGKSCALCPAQTWILDYCVGSSRELIDTKLYAGGNVQWCNNQIYPMCIANFQSERALYIAGDDSAALTLAASTFLPSTVSLPFSAKIISTSFRRHAAGFGSPCTVSTAGSLCEGVISLLAVPGLLIKTVPGEENHNLRAFPIPLLKGRVKADFEICVQEFCIHQTLPFPLLHGVWLQQFLESPVPFLHPLYSSRMPT
jgi:hypothetical protein